MKKIFLIFSLLISILSPQFAKGASPAEENISGYVLLQVEKNGEAWYVYPINGKRYYLGRPADAFNIMRTLGLGATHDFISNTTYFPSHVSGRILLDVESHGEAYYIYPKNRKKYYLGRPDDALRIMSELGRGITNADLSGISAGEATDPGTEQPNSKIILENIPFFAQAPLGEWNDPRQKDGCEEASSLMAVIWSREENHTQDEARQKIIDASDYILEKYGEFRDTSVLDTLNWIIRDYFNYQNATLKKNITKTDIIDELSKGNIIITPVNGQILGNPYYSSPGPVHHMLVVIGYDPAKKTFITNDPGTEMGKSHQYDTDSFFRAIRDYPTGFHEAVTFTEKNVIIIWK